MQALIRFFLELCLLRRAPQELPASGLLLGLALGANLGVGLLVALSAGLPFWLGLQQKLAETLLFLAALRIALGLTKHPGRFTQAATALFGAGALLGLLALPPLALDPTGTQDTDLAAIGALLLLALVIWSTLVSGHILRHAFDLTLGRGVVIAIAFEVFAVFAVGLLIGQG